MKSSSSEPVKSGLRLFYALWPDEETRQALAGVQSRLPGRKIPPENLHITLAFLGQQPPEKLPVLLAITGQLSAGAIHLLLDRTGYFPHNRISWAGMSDIPEALSELRKNLVARLREHQIGFDAKNRFFPHITLARQSERPAQGALTPISWQARRLALVQSVFNSGEKSAPPRYIILAERLLDL